ncbi:MAG: hypothetical protein GDA56_32725 [Hormoscilla sp. GM7CHS1pb]|nr:hypothetical protein [Hormoscilla sp. GM7CHS1pb]
MQIQGIKRGKTIELKEELNIPDGQKIFLEIQECELMTPEERLKKMKEFLAIPWEEKEDLIATLEKLEREKNAEWERLYGQFS